MAEKKKGMTPEDARKTKLRGHKKEREFAVLVGGEVIDGGFKKKDVSIGDDSASVKHGGRWQLNTLSEESVKKNTDIRSLAVAPQLKACLAVFPPKEETYQANKEKYKRELANKIYALCDKFYTDPKNITNYMRSALLSSGQVDFLAIEDYVDKKWHIFHQEDVYDNFINLIPVVPSGTYGPQKVIFQTRLPEQRQIRNAVEIEIRTTGPNYRKMVTLAGIGRGPIKDGRVNPFREWLWRIPVKDRILGGKVILHGKAAKKFKSKKVELSDDDINPEEIF